LPSDNPQVRDSVPFPIMLSSHVAPMPGIGNLFAWEPEA
jgi:hypothetical protein